MDRRRSTLLLGMPLVVLGVIVLAWPRPGPSGPDRTMKREPPDRDAPGGPPGERALSPSDGKGAEGSVRRDPGATVRGIAWSDEGVPIPGVWIRMEHPGDGGIFPAAPLPAEAITDGEGAYRLEGLPGASGYRISAAKEGWVTGREGDVTLLQGEETWIEFQLVRGAVVTGTIALPTGEPIAGAHAQIYRRVPGDDAVVEALDLRIRGRSPSGPGHVGMGSIDEGTTVTGEDGVFHLTGLLPGEKWLKVTHHGPGTVARSALKLDLARGEVRRLGAVILGDGEPSLLGTVRGPRGEAVEGAKLLIQALRRGPQGSEVWTDEAGRYAAWGYGPGEYVMAVRPPSPYGKIPFGESFLAETLPHRRDLVLEVPPPPGRIACRFGFLGELGDYEEAGARLTVLLFREDALHRRFPGMTVREGITLGRLEEGTYTVEASCVGGPWGDHYGRTGPIAVAPGETEEVRLEILLPAGAISGVVRDGESGSPRAGARIFRSTALPDPQGRLPDGTRAQEVESGEGGRFVLRGLPTDRVLNVIIKPPGSGRAVVHQAVAPQDLGPIDL